MIERALVVSLGTSLELGAWFGRPAISSGAAPGTLTLEENERQHIIAVMKMTDWKVRGDDGAAELLGLKPTTLESRMKKLNIERPR